MIARKVVPVLVAALFALMLCVSGCGMKRVDREGLDAAGRIAVVSVVLDRVADTSRDGNRVVLQASVNHARDRAEAGLAGARRWSVLDPAKEHQGKKAQAFGRVSDADLAALFPAPEERKRITALAQQELAHWKDRYIGAEGLPVIPHVAFAPEDDGPQSDPALRQVMLQQAGRLCSVLNVDAVAFMHLRASVTHPRDSTFIVTDNRTDGMLRVAATMVIVDRTGRLIADMGWPPLDSSARTHDLLPVYRGAGRDVVKQENIDLDDPRKKVPRAFSLLIDEALEDMMADLKAAAGK